jgi:hypothetical protein
VTSVRQAEHRGILRPLLVVLGSILIFAYGVIALISQDPFWFLTRATVPDPGRIVIRVDGVETVLNTASPGYELIVDGTRKALSGFKSWAPGSMGLSESTLQEYEQQGTILELYFIEPVDFHLPFDDGRPTALLIPIEGRFAGEGYVFRGKGGRWWAGQLIMRDPQPLLDALSTLGYIQQ